MLTSFGVLAADFADYADAALHCAVRGLIGRVRCYLCSLHSGL